MFMEGFNFNDFQELEKNFKCQGQALNRDHFQIYLKDCFCPIFICQLFNVPA